jgi:hypothetical protein
MGNTNATTAITDPSAHVVDKSIINRNYTVKLLNVLCLIQKTYNDPILEAVKHQLRAQQPIALNFVMEIKQYAYNYNILYVRFLSNWHSHFVYDWSSPFIPTEIMKQLKERHSFADYTQLLKDTDNSHIQLLIDCQCCMTPVQYDLYQCLSQEVLKQLRVNKT